VNLFDTSFIVANLIWGSVGFVYFIYGWRQKAMMPLLGGIAMIAVSYFVGSALLMSLLCIALIVGVHYLIKQGY